jgi:hypothetical protein
MPDKKIRLKLMVHKFVEKVLILVSFDENRLPYSIMENTYSKVNAI